MLLKEIILEKIQRISEDDFSRDILIPLLMKIGYSHAEFNGGAYEAGKDVIAYIQSGLGKQELHVFQSKKFKSTKNLDSRKDFDEYLYQIRQCLERKVTHQDGTQRYPNKAYFVTPFTIDSRHLEEQLHKLSQPNVEVLDGLTLTESIMKCWPSFKRDILGDDEIATIPNHDEVWNIELDNALHIEKKQSLTDFYNDLNFFVGRTDSSSVLGGTIKFSIKKEKEYTREEWNTLKELCKAIELHEGKSFIDTPLAEIDAKYDKELKSYEAQHNQDNIKKLGQLQEKAEYISKTMQKDAKKHLDTYTALKENNETSRTAADEANVDLMIKELNNFYPLQLQSNRIRSQLTQSLPKEAKNILENLYDMERELTKTQNQSKHISSEISPFPSITVALTPSRTAADINDRIKVAESCIRRLNNRAITNTETKDALDKINKLLRLVETITRDNTSSIITFFVNQERSETSVLDISAHSLFDSGCNIAIYGEAGAGKTTTLHRYAAKLFSSKTDDQIVLFMPLNRITKKINDLDEDLKKSSINLNTPFDSLLNAFLIYKNLPPSQENRRSLLLRLNNSKKCVVIADALDEACSHAPWVINALSELPSQISGAQVITSSRDCVKYIKEIDFLGITLLPFTEGQLKKFIFSWIAAPEESEDLWKKILDRKLYEVAKNPLLATIICTIHSNKIKIPENEPEIYWKKIELLCGLYDYHKGINRTKNDKSFLERCCIKLGYQFHKNEIRETSVHEIVKFLYSSFEGSISTEKIQSAVDDLIFICNILIKQPDSENYGFEHLRYQELLAAKEIEQNRSIDMVELASQEWWKGALFLYAHYHDIQFLIDDIYNKKSNITRYADVLLKMIEARPTSSQAGLKSLVLRLSKQDRFDGLWADDYYSEHQRSDDYY